MSKFKEKDWWLTANGKIAIITQTWEKNSGGRPGSDRSMGRANIFHANQMDFKDMIFSTQFSEDWMVQKITKETNPEYYL